MHLTFTDHRQEFVRLALGSPRANVTSTDRIKTCRSDRLSFQIVIPNEQLDFRTNFKSLIEEQSQFFTSLLCILVVARESTTIPGRAVNAVDIRLGKNSSYPRIR